MLRPGDVPDVVVGQTGVEGHECGLPGRRVGAGAPEVHELGEPQVEGGIPITTVFPSLGSLHIFPPINLLTFVCSLIFFLAFPDAC